jgi:hypothetical protein
MDSQPIFCILKQNHITDSDRRKLYRLHLQHIAVSDKRIHAPTMSSEAQDIALGQDLSGQQQKVNPIAGYRPMFHDNTSYHSYQRHILPKRDSEASRKTA